MWKSSKYSAVVVHNEKNYLLNTYTGAIGIIDDNLKKTFQQGVFKETDTAFNQLASNGFIVPEYLDEYQKILDNEIAAIYQRSDRLVFSIATSMQCNYACKYCFESEIGNQCKKTMSAETAEQVANYIIKQINPITRKLIIMWFGGEPLIGYDAICTISDKLIKECAEKNIEYAGRIITNGFFLTEDRAKELATKYHVSIAQVTLDGPADIYEREKNAPNGSYQRVLENIKRASKYLTVHIRLNIKKNYYSQLISYTDSLLDSLGKDNSRIKIYLANVYEDWSNESNQEIMSNEAYIRQNECFSEHIKKLYPGKLINEPILSYAGLKCGLAKKYNAVIGAEGELYRCEHLLGRKNQIIGSVFEGLYHNLADQRFNSIIHPNKCRSCLVFPICMSGCPLDLLEGKDRIDCELYRENVIASIIKKADK